MCVGLQSKLKKFERREGRRAAGSPRWEQELCVCRQRGSSRAPPGLRGGPGRGRTRTFRGRSAFAPSSDLPSQRGSGARTKQNLRRSRSGPLRARFIHRLRGKRELVTILQSRFRIINVGFSFRLVSEWLWLTAALYQLRAAACRGSEDRLC